MISRTYSLRLALLIVLLGLSSNILADDEHRSGYKASTRNHKDNEIEHTREGRHERKRRRNPKPPNGPKVGESTCDFCMSRAAQVAAGNSTFLPIFLKFHKVGSGTVADLMRRHCNSISKRVSPAGAALPTFPWRGGTHCGLGPHEHATMDIYHAAGLEGLELCSQQRAPVRGYTILRDPVEKFLSGIYFWKRAIPADLAPKLLEPSSITLEDAERLANEVYKRGESSMGRAGPLLQYSYVLGRLKMTERDTPSAEQTAASCRKLEEEFTVGTTEQMDSFLVLVALENQWPLEEMCYYRSHVNKARPKRKDFQPEVVQYLEGILAKDAELVSCAAAAHQRQTAAWPNFTQALAQYQSPEFVDTCAAIKKRNERAAGKLTKAEHRQKKAQECVLSYYLERERSGRRKAQFLNSSADSISVDEDTSAKKASSDLFSSPSEFLRQNHSPKSQLGW